MKIVRLEAENILRLAAVAIEPSGDIVEITGENGAGKSSTLNAIWMALGGEKTIPPEPIKLGADKGYVRLDLGDLTVTRTFKRRDDGDYSTTLTVENKEGMRPQSPQNLLSTLVGRLAFDPLEFTRLKPEDQMKALRVFVPDYDFDAAAQANKEDFANRTDHNRHAKQLRAQADGIDAVGAPEKPFDLDALIEDLEAVGTHNADIERRRAKRDEFARGILANEERISRLDESIANREREIEALKRELATVKEDRQLMADTVARDKERLAAAPALPDPKDPSEIRGHIESAQRMNALFEKAQRKAELEKQAAEAEKRAEALTAAMAARIDAMDAAVAAAKMPVDGLTFGDGEILLNGVPFEQGSMAEKIRTSVAIAAAMNPKLRIAHVRDGSLLDRKSWQALAEFAREADMQVWVESVDSTRPGAIVIEDGRVRDAALEAAE